MQDRYWSSQAGHRHKKRWRDRRRVLALVEQEPEKKGKRGARSAAAFHHQFNDRSVGGARGFWPRARLALDLHFTTARKQPPNIESLAKHYLDLLGHLEGDDGRPLLYLDDSQVKMLHVSCDHAWDPDTPAKQGSIRLECAPRVDAIAELEAVHEIAVAGRDFDWDVEEPQLENRDLELRLESARAFESSGDPDSRRMAADIRFEALRDHQEFFLRASDRWLSGLFRRRARELITGKPAPWEARAARAVGSLEAWRELQEPFGPVDIASELRGFFLVPLPALPARSGEGELFRQALDEACRRFLGKHPSLSPLVAPLRVTILAVPPQQKDLDNLAREVVPAINRHFRPPQDPWVLDETHVGLPPGLRSRDDRRRRRDLARLRSIGQYSVWAYQVIQLRRRPEHPREGWMAVVLGHGENRNSLWGQAGIEVERALEHNE